MKNENKSYILVIDSGNGGEYTLHYLRKYAMKEDFLFLKDVKNAPYGEKTKQELLRISINNINGVLKRYNIKMIILACNTLSTTIINEIRSQYQNVMVLGVTPDIETALEYDGEILVLSTTATLKLGKIDTKYRDNKRVHFVGFDNLAKMIDDNLHNLDSLIPYLENNLNEYKNVKNVVLGCTHYNLIKSQLKNVLNEDVKFFENSEKVALEMRESLKVLNLSESKQKENVQVKTKNEIDLEKDRNKDIVTFEDNYAKFGKVKIIET